MALISWLRELFDMSDKDTIPVPMSVGDTLPSSPHVPAINVSWSPVWSRLESWQDDAGGGVREFQVSRTCGFYFCWLLVDDQIYISGPKSSREKAVSEALGQVGA
jgi:hypothetical protein